MPKRKKPMLPLAWRLRPTTLDEVVGQEHIVGPDSPLRNAILKDQIHSFVLYGPPGTGKTSIARIIARMTNSHFDYMQAVTAGVSDIRKVAVDAQDRLKYYQQQTILFVDEIHRFNKSQQDVLLPFVEDGTLILVGATTENPLYELNTALLSRMKLYILEALRPENIEQIITNALKDRERGSRQSGHHFKTKRVCHYLSRHPRVMPAWLLIFWIPSETHIPLLVNSWRLLST